VSDIDTEWVDSLKALDPERPIREADIAGCDRGARSRIFKKHSAIRRMTGNGMERSRWPPGAVAGVVGIWVA
jgi:hypothetical protein